MKWRNPRSKHHNRLDDYAELIAASVLAIGAVLAMVLT